MSNSMPGSRSFFWMSYVGVGVQGLGTILHSFPGHYRGLDLSLTFFIEVSDYKRTLHFQKTVLNLNSRRASSSLFITYAKWGRYQLPPTHSNILAGLAACPHHCPVYRTGLAMSDGWDRNTFQKRGWHFWGSERPEDTLFFMLSLCR